MPAAQAAPTSGATMNTHTWDSAVMSPFAAIMSAGPKLRAGLTEVPVRGDAHDVDESQRQADDDAGERSGLLVGRGAQHRQNEDAGQNNLNDKGARHAQAHGRGGVVAVAAKARFQNAAQIAHVDDEHEHGRSHNTANELGNPVPDKVLAVQALVQKQPKGHGRVDVAARHVSNDERHGHNRQPERHGDAERAQGGAGDGGAAAAEQCEDEGAERLGGIFLQG